jgi:DNA-binding HxlR family transcriptional regulator
MQSQSNANEVCICALNGIMNLMGKKWVLFAINSIGNHSSIRFKELYGELRGVSPSTLSWILRQLESAGIIERRAFAETPPRVEYSLTSNGKELRQAIIPLLAWASRQDTYTGQLGQCNPKDYVNVSLVPK